MSGAGLYRLLVAAAVLVSFVLAAPVAARTPTVTVVHEGLVSTVPSSLSTRSREPSVATHPTDPNRIAIAYPRGDTHPSVVIRISHDGGRTFRTAAGRPSGGGNHPVIAWGPGPKAGSARLYYMAMTTFGGRCCYPGISSSDNEGRTWSKPFVSHGTTPWFGGFPELSVDDNMGSPNHGVVYAAYNWPKDPNKGPGLRLMASSDFGRSFHGVEVPVARPPAGYGDTWRIGYRIRSAPDGSAYVAFYQRDVRSWHKATLFSYGGMANVGRIGFSVTRFTYHPSTGRFSLAPTVSAARLPKTAWNLGNGTPVAGLTDPMWDVGFDVDPATGTVYLATGVDGAMRVYQSTDQGATWTYRTLPAAAPYAGRAQRLFHPNLLVGHGFIMITLHATAGGSVSNAYAVSFDHAITWSRPTAMSGSRWRTSNMGGTYNGVGLRERAALTADGTHVFVAYGDGRRAAGHHGFSAVYGDLLAVTTSTPTPTPVPDPTPSPSVGVTPDPTPEPTPVVTPDPTPEPTLVVTPDPTPEPTPT